MDKTAKAKKGYLAVTDRKNPPGVDASMGLKGPSVDDGATRKGVAATPRTLGPRTA